MTLSILNYGMANLRSVQKAFEAVGHVATLITTPDEIRRTDKLVLPGVGAVGDALAHLRAAHLDETILEHIRAGKPFLGICLGLQMLMETCHEGGTHAGLGVLKGDAVRFDVDTRHGLKVPHMGWNELDVKRDAPILKNLPGKSVYFVHGYYVRPTDPTVIATTTDYGEPFVSSIWRDNVTAVQFHPEKSQAVGLKMLENFARQ
jgi:imidazole glycerol-phosphate synthase subunit HisH